MLLLSGECEFELCLLLLRRSLRSLNLIIPFLDMTSSLQDSNALGNVIFIPFVRRRRVPPSIPDADPASSSPPPLTVPQRSYPRPDVHRLSTRSRCHRFSNSCRASGFAFDSSSRVRSFSSSCLFSFFFPQLTSNRFFDSTRVAAPADLPPKPSSSPEALPDKEYASPLGMVPHQLRGGLSMFTTLNLAGEAFDMCTACGSKVSRIHLPLAKASSNPI